MMKDLFESFRAYSLDENEALLIEGRKEDAAKKYPELAKKREELEGESLLDTLIAADPSGNQKYLMGAARILQRSIENAEQNNGYEPFWGKQWPEDADDNLYSPWGVSKNIADLLPKYHKLMAYIRDQDAPFKDINNIKNYSALQAVVNTAQSKKASREQEKKEKAELKRVARETSEVIADTPYHLVVRPLSKEASCYFGRETRWCISATKSANYFDQYTSEGKAFLFLLAKKKDIDPAYAKLAVVIDQNGYFDDYYDAEDDNLYLRMFKDAVRQTMLGKEASGEITAMEEDEPYKKEPIMKAAAALDLMRLVDEDDEIETVVQLINETVEEYIDDLERKGGESVQDTPAGTPDEAYEDKLAEYDFDNVYVTLSFPSETGLDYAYWEANLGVDLDNLLERAEGWELTTGDWDEWDGYTLRDLVDTMMNEVGVWPEEVEQDYIDPAAFNVRLEGDGGSLESFDSWLDNLDHEDDKISADLLEAFIETASEVDPPIIRNPAKEAEEKEAARQLTRDAEYWPDPEEKKKQMDLPLQENRIRLKIVKNKQQLRIFFPTLIVILESICRSPMNLSSSDPTNTGVFDSTRG